MKTVKASLVLLLALFITLTGFAQEADLTGGELSDLKDKSTINYKFTCEKLGLGAACCMHGQANGKFINKNAQ